MMDLTIWLKKLEEINRLIDLQTTHTQHLISAINIIKNLATEIFVEKVQQNYISLTIGDVAPLKTKEIRTQFALIEKLIPALSDTINKRKEII